MKGDIEKVIPEIVMTIVIFLMILAISIGIPFIIKGQIEKDFNAKIDSLETVINDMRALDSLTLDMTEYLSKDVEVLNENHEILSTQVQRVERKVKKIDADMSACD